MRRTVLAATASQRDLHRHEETDEPAFRAWLANTFPTLISAVRTLAQQTLHAAASAPWNANGLLDSMLDNLQRDPRLGLSSLRALASWYSNV